MAGLNIKAEVDKDAKLKKMLYYHLNFEQSLDRFSAEDFLVIDEYMDIPFFATTRDYVGAYEKDNAKKAKWIVKRISEEEECQFRMGMICYFVNYFTGNISAPSLVTKIQGKSYRASKIMLRTEQLSGAPYLEEKRLRGQLALDLINSWVFFDEDRNPNNYLIYYTLSNFPVVIAIDFSNVDLKAEEMKVRGMDEQFGWERSAKTRYMTPLKTELFYTYKWDFFEDRFQRFDQLDTKLLQEIGNRAMQHLPTSERGPMVEKLSSNILSRRDYVRDYFQRWFANEENWLKLQDRTVEDMHKEYGIMGSTFLNLQKDFENK